MAYNISVKNLCTVIIIVTAVKVDFSNNFISFVLHIETYGISLPRTDKRRTFIDLSFFNSSSFQSKRV